MRIAEMLNAIAAWLESPSNEALLLAEENEECMKVVAGSCVLAAALLKKAAEEVDVLEPAEPSKITPESIQEIANLATALDSSDDPRLKKQASVLDELLLTIASPPNALAQKQAEDDNRIEELRKKYQGVKEELHKIDKVSDTVKAIEKSNLTKHYQINEHPLNTRYCPDHFGQSTYRVGEHIVQCPLDKKTYNFETGYTLENGQKVPGGSVDLRTSNSVSAPFETMFDNRNQRLGQHS